MRKPTKYRCENYKKCSLTDCPGIQPHNISDHDCENDNGDKIKCTKTSSCFYSPTPVKCIPALKFPMPKKRIVSIDFPYVKNFAVYRDIADERCLLESLTDSKDIKAKELGYDEGNYIGLFYLKGHRPTKKEIQALLEEKD